ncbi:MAG: FecR domain-containing protein [Anaerohalosphaera sp.]|nr:FecR domain-containing protein [Anaerohalosphaera sp.]
MESEIYKKHLITELAFKAFDGVIAPEERTKLNALLREDLELQDYYIELVRLCSTVSRFSNSGIDINHSSEVEIENFEEAMMALAENEKTAPGVLVEKPTEKPVELMPGLLKTVKLERKISRLAIYTLALSTAAMLFLMTIVLLSPIRPIVATLTDSINAEWTSEENIPAKWDVLSQGELTLVRGLAEITFNNGAVVIIEGPAEFELESVDEMILHTGRLYAMIPGRATGFVVKTPTTTIIDLGTEFGLKVDPDGLTDVHMVKGRAFLVPEGNGRKGIPLFPGIAKSVDSNAIVSDIMYNEERFNKKIPTQYERAILASKPEFYWQFSPDDRSQVKNSVGPHVICGRYSEKMVFVEGSELLSGEPFNAIDFSGTNSYIVAEGLSAYSAGSYSYSLWIRPDKITDQCILLSSYGSGSVSQRILGLSEKGRFEHRSDSNVEIRNAVVTSRTVVKPGRWYHIIVSCKANGRKVIFVDGREEDSIQVGSIEEVRPDKIYVAGYPSEFKLHYPSHPFNGAISEIVRYDRALTAEEVKQLYLSAVSKKR